MARPEEHKERFSISMPPPNETGTLSIGHALFLTLQDIMTRYNRMQGKDVLWLPGTDHAALPVNAIIEKKLADQGKTKHDVGREEFLKQTKEFVAGSRDTMLAQMRAMGASCDWSRQRYTLDDTLSRCVNETFAMMFKDGLIYRGHRIVNWDPKLETTVSDDEVERIEEKAPFYTFQYGPFEISTARPETKFGDKYVVMHPDDKRYAKYKHGDTFETEWINGKVTATIIKDEAVDPAFGTGVMTITPWHDHTDFEIAERHKLDKEQIIDFEGKLLPVAEEFKGMYIHEARPLIVKKLKEKGLLVKIDEDYVHNIAVNERGKGIIEPQIKLQWFVDVNKEVVKWKGKTLSLKAVMRDVVDSGDIAIIPNRFNKTYKHWIDNLRDWCVSRQIWWGHRIPVWYRHNDKKEQEVYSGHVPPKDDNREGWSNWEQDPDTLDTWFSSALWTWSTLIDPKLAENTKLSLNDLLKKSRDYQTYHPTTVMETGWDIIFFWVARMILATTYVTGEVPFTTVYLHGMVRAEDGKKMSKSRPESIVDPVDIIKQNGTDALRMALIMGVTPGNDQNWGQGKLEANRNFCNKLWNVARFVEDRVGDEYHKRAPKPKSTADYWILHKLQQSTEVITAHLDKFQFSEAYDELYRLLWNDFADWYIEASKLEPNNNVLAYGLETIIKLAHPFAPFVTETIWQTLKWEKDSLLMSSEWPRPTKVHGDYSQDFQQVQDIVTEIRFIKGVMHLPNDLHLYHSGEPFLKTYGPLIAFLARLESVSEVNDGHGLHLTSTTLKCWLDVDTETSQRFLTQLRTKYDEQTKHIEQFTARLNNKAYVAGAPKHLVDETKQQLAEAKAARARIKEEYNRFSTTKH